MISLMAPFDHDPESVREEDEDLAMHGPVILYFRKEVLDEAAGWLADRAYDMVSVDASAWLDTSEMLRALPSALSLPDFGYEYNLDILNDELRGLAGYLHGTTPAAAGFVLVLVHYDRFVQRDPIVAHSLLDMYADAAYLGALIGHRMLCLVQSDNPRLRFASIGCRHADWNRKEWLNSARGVGPGET